MCGSDAARSSVTTSWAIRRALSPLTVSRPTRSSSQFFAISSVHSRAFSVLSRALSSLSSDRIPGPWTCPPLEG